MYGKDFDQYCRRHLGLTGDEAKIYVAIWRELSDEDVRGAELSRAVLHVIALAPQELRPPLLQAGRAGRGEEAIRAGREAGKEILAGARANGDGDGDGADAAATLLTAQEVALQVALTYSAALKKLNRRKKPAGDKPVTPRQQSKQLLSVAGKLMLFVALVRAALDNGEALPEKTLRELQGQGQLLTEELPIFLAAIAARLGGNGGGGGPAGSGGGGLKQGGGRGGPQGEQRKTARDEAGSDPDLVWNSSKEPGTSNENRPPPGPPGGPSGAPEKPPQPSVQQPTTTQPSVATQPSAQAQPGAQQQPTPTAQPSAQPTTTTAQPSAQAQPGVQQQPTTTVQPSMAMQPSAPTQPGAQQQPTPTAQPSAQQSIVVHSPLPPEEPSLAMRCAALFSAISAPMARHQPQQPFSKPQ